jgi:hypothetical protein
MKEQGFEFYRCEYDEGRQFHSAGPLVHEMIDQARREGASLGDVPWDPRHYDIFKQFADRILRIAVGMKHHAFREEVECRFAASVPNGQEFPAKIEFREGSSSLIPYLAVRLRTREGDALPITKITVGPTPYAGASINALKSFLGASNMGDVAVVGCDIPFRS